MTRFEEDTMHRFAHVGVLALALAGTAGLAAVRAQEVPTCKAVHADLVEDASTNCRPPHTSCFLGVVDGNHGLRGTTYFKGDPGAGTPPATSPDFRAYSGVFEYATDRGTLTMRETGAVSGTQGVVTAYQKITDATGEFAGVTGYVFVNGFTRSGHVTTKVSGEFCYP
jgi:hypothetical protein